MTQFVDAIYHARNSDDPEQYIDLVKSAVREEFASIDPSAELTDTQYFNHSAVPDFVMTWPDRAERRLYIRDSYESIVAANDAVRFDVSRPMVLALTESSGQKGNDPVANTAIALQSERAPHTLITSPAALDTVSETNGDRLRNPVDDLIRVNLARGGRGLLTASRVDSLLRGDAEEQTGAARSYIERLSESFLPETARHIARTADLIALATSDDDSVLSNLREETGTDLRENLTSAEIRHLLPWLLTHQDVTNDQRFWSYLGQLITFSDLDEAKEDLAGIALNPIISANMDRWGGKRAYVGLASLPHENASEDEIEARKEGIWSFIGSTIGVNFGDSRLQLAPSGSRLRGRDGRSSALWADLSQALEGFKVASVRLTGVSRSIAVSAEESNDITQDVEDITESVDDTYYVRSLGLTFPSIEGEGEVEVAVKFDEKIVSSDSTVALSDLAESALKVLLYRDEVTDDVIDSLLGRSVENGSSISNETKPVSTD